MSRTRSSSTTSSSTLNSTEDARVAADGGAIVTRGDVSVVDGGAIEMAGTIAEEVVHSAERLALMGRDFGNAGFELAEQVIEQQRNEATQLSDTLIKVGIPAVVIGVIAWSVWK